LLQNDADFMRDTMSDL